MKNILFFCTDQHRADHLGFGGNETVRTPNLDALAARATVFDRAYVANPVCMPNRSSILTGRLPSAHGVVFNDRSLEWGANTFVRRLSAAGYRTQHVGKAHIQVHARHFFPAPDGAPVGELGWPEGWDHLESAPRYRDHDPGVTEDFYGFDRAEFCLGHGAAIGGHHLRWALDRGLDPSTAGPGPNGPADVRSDNWWQVMRPAYEEGLHSTEFVTARATDFIESVTASNGRGGQSGDGDSDNYSDNYSTENQPWFLFASYPDPHHPFAPPGEWYDRHNPADMILPESFTDPVDDLPVHLRQMTAGTGARGPMRIGEAALRDAMAAEYGSIELIDAGIGRVLGALERSGQADDTIVVFTADHGDMFGDHGFMLKGGMVFEGTTRVPLLISTPGSGDPGSRSSSLASSLDIGSTLLDLVGVDSYDGVQGVSLAPILDDPNATVRDHVLIEEDVPDYGIWENQVPAHSRTVVTDNARITRYSTGEGELYDLDADRGERRNLFDRVDGSEHRQHRDLRHHMVDRLTDALVSASDYARPTPHPG